MTTRQQGEMLAGWSGSLRGLQNTHSCLLLLGYRSNSEDQNRWRRQGGELGDASFALALLSVCPLVSGRSGLAPLVCWAAFALRKQRVRAPQPAQRPSASPCCSGAAGVAILAIAAHSDGCAGAGATEGQPGRRGQGGTPLLAALGTQCAIFIEKFKSGPMRIVVRQRP